MQDASWPFLNEHFIIFSIQATYNELDDNEAMHAINPTDPDESRTTNFKASKLWKGRSGSRLIFRFWTSKFFRFSTI